MDDIRMGMEHSKWIEVDQPPDSIFGNSETAEHWTLA